MIESQRKKLSTHPHKILSIGITADGTPPRSVGVPWQATVNAFNMRIPDLYLAPEDLMDEALWRELQRFRVNGCYSFCPLEDYSFLARLPQLQDITICRGEKLRDLEFLRSMEDWFLLHIEDAVLDDLAPLFPDGRRRGMGSTCVCLSGCTVADLSALEQEGVRLSELVVLMPQGADQRDRWKNVRCGKYTYHEYKLPEV